MPLEKECSKCSSYLLLCNKKTQNEMEEKIIKHFMLKVSIGQGFKMSTVKVAVFCPIMPEASPGMTVSYGCL